MILAQWAPGTLLAVMYYIIVSGHNSSFPDPIQFSPGDQLTLGKRDAEFPGWVWVTTPSGNEGWAPEALIRRESDSAGVALEGYTARELDTVEGERVFCTRELAGWLWVENQAGQSGWIPGKTARAEEGKV